MCLAVVVGPKSTLTKDNFKRAWEKNPHGGGLVYIKNKTLWIYKTQDSWENLYKAFEVAENESDSDTDILVHFRFATHGSKCLENTHPFVINKNRAALIHNGVININREGDRTDSEQFARDFIEPFMLNGWIEHESVIKFLEYTMGGSKIAILRIDQPTLILNKNKGHVQGDSWFSNLSHQEPAPVSHHAYSSSKKNKPNKKFFKSKKRIGEIVFRSDEGMSVYMGEGKCRWIPKGNKEYDSNQCLSCGNVAYADEWALCYQCRPEEFCSKCGRKIYEAEWKDGLCYVCRYPDRIAVGYQSSIITKKPDNIKATDLGEIHCSTCNVIMDDLDLDNFGPNCMCKDCIEDFKQMEEEDKKKEEVKLLEPGIIPTCKDCFEPIIKETPEDPNFFLTDRCWSCEKVKHALNIEAIM